MKTSIILGGIIFFHVAVLVYVIANQNLNTFDALFLLGCEIALFLSYYAYKIIKEVQLAMQINFNSALNHEEIQEYL